MIFDYARKPLPISVMVHLLDTTVGTDKQNLSSKLLLSADRFGFTYIPSDAKEPEQAADEKMCHFIYRTGDAFSEGAVELAMKWLRFGWSVSIAFQYMDEAHMLSFRERIDVLKRELGDRINFLRPDVINDVGFCVSHKKLIDNAVCDTVRVKYVPRQRSTTDVWGMLQPELRKFFLLASDVYKRYNLFLRYPTDGYFAIRTDTGFAVTSTKTDKIQLDTRRISLVHNYDTVCNELDFTGMFLPSSDSVEAAIVFSRLPQIQCLIHTHASDRFTRNPNFSDRRRVPFLSYGEVALGESIALQLQECGDGFVIMEEHGEVFCDAGGGAEEAINTIEHWCQIGYERDRLAPQKSLCPSHQSATPIIPSASASFATY